MAKNEHAIEEKIQKQIQRRMSVRQKLGLILESKVVQKLNLLKKDTKKWSPKLIFLDNFLKKFDWFLTSKIDWEYNFGTFWQTVIHGRISFKNPFSMLIFGQKCCLLGPTIFKNSTTELILISMTSIVEYTPQLKSC